MLGFAEDIMLGKKLNDSEPESVQRSWSCDCYGFPHVIYLRPRASWPRYARLVSVDLPRLEKITYSSPAVQQEAPNLFCEIEERHRRHSPWPPAASTDSNEALKRSRCIGWRLEQQKYQATRWMHSPLRYRLLSQPEAPLALSLYIWQAKNRCNRANALKPCKRCATLCCACVQSCLLLFAAWVCCSAGVPRLQHISNLWTYPMA